MPVLIEGVCILLRKGSIIERYQGGYGQFIFDLNDRTRLCECNDLLSVSFDNHDLARAYLKFLVERGLKVMLLNEVNPNNTDAILVDQVFGPSFRVYWLDFIHLSSNPHKLKTQSKRRKTGGGENIVIAASDQEVDEKEEARLIGWEKDEIAFPKDWKFKSSKSMNLEFLRMAENRSKQVH